MAGYGFGGVAATGFHPTTYKSGGYLSVAPVRIQLLTLVVAATDDVRLSPFFPTLNFSCDQLYISVSVAAGNARAVIYSAGTDNLPDSLLAESASTPIAAPSTFFPINYTFVSGNKYWIGLHTDSNPQIRSLDSVGTIALVSPTPGAAGNQPNGGVFSSPYAGGAPLVAPALTLGAGFYSEMRMV